MNVHFYLPEFSVIKIVTWKCHVDASTTGRYGMIICRDLLTTLVLDIKFSQNTVIGGELPYKGCLEPMVDVSNYDFKILIDNTVKP